MKYVTEVIRAHKCDLCERSAVCLEQEYEEVVAGEEGLRTVWIDRITNVHYLPTVLHRWCEAHRPPQFEKKVRRA